MCINPDGGSAFAIVAVADEEEHTTTTTTLEDTIELLRTASTWWSVKIKETGPAENLLEDTDGLLRLRPGGGGRKQPISDLSMR